MIQIETIKEIPELRWSAHTEAIWQSTGIQQKRTATSTSEIMYLLRSENGPIMVLGVQQTSLITGLKMWCLICECNLRKQSRALRMLLHRYVRSVGHLAVTVDKEFTKGTRFAEFMGFRRTAEVTALDGKTYCWFGLDREWLTHSH